MTFEKNHVYKNVLELALTLSILEVDVLFAYTENFWNIIIGLYGISPIAHQIHFIFWKVIPYRQVFYINRIK